MTLTRKRTVTPEVFARLSALPPEVRLTEHGLRLYADDHGRGRANIRLILAELYPQTSEFNEQTITDHLMTLAEAGALDLYPDDRGGGMVFQFADWPTVDRPGKTELPAPPDWQDSRASREAFARDSRDSRETFVAGERGSDESGGGRDVGEEWEGEGEGASEREESEARSRVLREEMPPSPFCPAHEASGGVEYPCISCQNARLHNRHYLQRRSYDMRQQVRGDDAED